MAHKSAFYMLSLSGVNFPYHHQTDGSPKLFWTCTLSSVTKTVTVVYMHHSGCKKTKPAVCDTRVNQWQCGAWAIHRCLPHSYTSVSRHFNHLVTGINSYLLITEQLLDMGPVRSNLDIRFQSRCNLFIGYWTDVTDPESTVWCF